MPLRETTAGGGGKEESSCETEKKVDRRKGTQWRNFKQHFHCLLHPALILGPAVAKESLSLKLVPLSSTITTVLFFPRFYSLTLFSYSFSSLTLLFSRTLLSYCFRLFDKLNALIGLLADRSFTRTQPRPPWHSKCVLFLFSSSSSVYKCHCVYVSKAVSLSLPLPRFVLPRFMPLFLFVWLKS